MSLSIRSQSSATVSSGRAQISQSSSPLTAWRTTRRPASRSRLRRPSFSEPEAGSGASSMFVLSTSTSFLDCRLPRPTLEMLSEAAEEGVAHEEGLPGPSLPLPPAATGAAAAAATAETSAAVGANVPTVDRHPKPSLPPSVGAAVDSVSRPPVTEASSLAPSSSSSSLRSSYSSSASLRPTPPNNFLAHAPSLRPPAPLWPPPPPQAPRAWEDGDWGPVACSAPDSQPEWWENGLGPLSSSASSTV
mmetsp:Transcript_74749/g.188198  ORF Transcript_74749/g.188198 Transcript_74749/m.188198 type:complete len:247 (-) Transcript_74749:79-819(-)